MKCYIILVHTGRHGKWPDTVFLKQIGHDLTGLLQTICREYFGGTTRPLMRAELEFLKTDRILTECVRILSSFGEKGRYYNLDVITGSQDPMLSDPKEEWEALESEVESPLPYVTNVELSGEYYPRVNQKLIARMERLARAIALQFTIGDHPDPERNMIMLSASISEFIHMKEFGTNDYRKSVRILRREKDNWEERSDFEILNNPWPTRVVTREANDEQWPFRVDQVIVERRSRIFYIVNLEGYAFALNGAARTRYQYPDAHAAGLAIIGKSVGPFIDLARELK